MLPRSLLVSNKIAAIVASTLAYFVTTQPFTPTLARCSDCPTLASHCRVIQILNQRQLSSDSYRDECFDLSQNVPKGRTKKFLEYHFQSLFR